MYCDTEETDKEGRTELDRIWVVAKELVEEKILRQASYKELDSSIVAIKCFTEDYSDIEKVMKSAAELRRIHFPGLFYMKTNYVDEIGKSQFITRYLHCCDGDLYVRNYVNQMGFHLLKSNTSANK